MSALVATPATAIVEAPRYEAMREAVALCATVDEAKEIRDRAAALAFYARQRDDQEVLVWVQEIKLRAGRRIGELLRDIERQRTGRPSSETRLRAEPSLITRAIDGAGLRRAEAYELQAIAGPQDPRLRAVADEAAESYLARAKADQQPATQAGLKQAVIGAVHAALGPDEIRRMGKTLKRDAQAQKAIRRAQRELDLTDATRSAGDRLGSRLYAVVYADPPWRFEVQSRETGMDRAADNHYPTMPTEEICALQVPAAPDAALFLWATAPMLEHGLAVLRAWGFAYRSNLVWNKTRVGTGYWARNKHEHLLIGTRGTVPAPAPGTQPESVVDAAVGRHSAKPADFAEIIERIFPSAPKVELFARTPRRGWDAWGNEAVGAAA
ncbi:MAG: MT-A70 family methyltransferase [Janthinobacterium lividum]